MNNLYIEVVHDIVCSWCAIGFKHLTDALDDLGVEADIKFIPQQLNPSMGPRGMKIEQYFKMIHGWSEKKHNDYRKSLNKVIEASGTNIDFSHRTHYFNTFLAHRLTAEAEFEGLGRALHQQISVAYHARGENISDPKVLRDLATKVGLTTAASERALDRRQTSLAYEVAVKRRSEFSVASVPAWVINGEDLIVGSKSRAFFKEYISTFL